jgi:hypothetical protein
MTLYPSCILHMRSLTVVLVGFNLGLESTKNRLTYNIRSDKMAETLYQ